MCFIADQMHVGLVVVVFKSQHMLVKDKLLKYVVLIDKNPAPNPSGKHDSYSLMQDFFLSIFVNHPWLSHLPGLILRDWMFLEENHSQFLRFYREIIIWDPAQFLCEGGD